MKAPLILAAVMFSFSAFAKPQLPQALVQKLAKAGVHIRMDDSGGNQPGQPGPVAQPIRQAQLKIVVDKQTAVQQPDGSYNISVDTVCSKTVPIPVYDLRQTNSTVQVTDSLVCDSTVSSHPVQVHVVGVLVLSNDSPMPDEPKKDLKGIWMFSYASDVASTAEMNWMSSNTGTPEIGASTHYGFLAPDYIFSGGQQPSVSETFSASYEIVDQP